ncbi:NEL-type E3 ubiquitin ligase domain-containing protein [Pseudomonas kermanshahensis]|uniref:NEL-type E3 ubiquitin ligase domain-containing protein n=1 Tax=Pseudomonas kermanshahensis TaxID=2745482 RepID=UPI0023D9856B|nr:NEL-type E3 ubiquitin ligase domain-containing protein [Pseudomonas kermanshahensis]WEL57365.1 NEL-type E3 ubiquitin ligase domain-containing protein [Pseudomonas kermanshahensis]
MGTTQSPGEQAGGNADVRPDTLQHDSDAFQDGFIGRRLPLWLRKAPVEQLPAISRALAKSLESRQQLRALLMRIENIDGFVASRLEKALSERYGVTYNLHRLKFLEGRREPVINAQPVGAHLTEVVYDEKPLLEVALRNFTAEQASAGGQPAGNRLLVPRSGARKPPTAIAFAALCRELDLGQGYQQHLDSILKPANDEKSIETLLVDTARYAMLVDAYKARQDNVLDASELQLLVGMCIDRMLLRLAGDLVVAKRLKLLGYALEHVVVLDVIDQGPLFNTTRRLLMYVPGDPVAPWSAFESLRDLNRELGHRLRVKSYQQFFSRFVLRRDSQAFFATVIPVFDDLPAWASYDLAPRLQAYPAPVFNSLAQSRIRQIKEDAAMIAVPVARLDREVQRAHDERLAAEGWVLLNLASFFVPGLGLVMLAVTAWELLGEVYHGVEALHDGDAREALDHLTNVATDLAAIAATVAGVTVAQRVWPRSGVVDAMVPAQLEGGTRKLWQQDLAPYRSVVPSAAATQDALGIRRHGAQTWIEMDGHHYPVVDPGSDGQWQLRPRSGNGPALRHNGAGAWRVWSEQPAQWDDTYRMFRRLGTPLDSMTDEQIDQVLNFHDLGADHLRALHVYARAPEAGMLDSAERSRIDRRIRQMISSLRAGEPVEDLTVLQHAQRLPGAEGASDPVLAELAWAQRRFLLGQVYNAVQASDSPASALLRTVFPGLHPRAARALLAAASGGDRRRLLQSGRVPLNLAEAARHSVSTIRRVRVLEALCLDTPQNADLARVVLGLLKHLPGTGQGVRWRLFEGHLGGPLLTSTDDGVQAFDLLHHNGAFQLLDAQGIAQGGAGELFEVMAAAYTPHQRASMQVGDPFAHNLRVALTREAMRRRVELEGLLGVPPVETFRRPQRLVDGRLGYPLGGRNSGGPGRPERALAAMVRDLYPSFSDEQVTVWCNNVRRSGRQLETVLAELRAELRVLRNTLEAWVGQADGEVREDRLRMRDTLQDCWQRTTDAGQAHLETDRNYRMVLYNMRPGELPEIPAQVSFAHVSNVSLLRMELQAIPASFLLAFPQVRMLDLGGNLLTRLPQPLLQMQHLRQLSLTNNRIVLSISQAATLASSTTLEYIDLSHNPLGRTFTLSGLTALRWLNLRDTGLTHFPHGVDNRSSLVFMDMRENRITRIPQWFYQLAPEFRRRFRLAGNPLQDAELVRLQAALAAPLMPLDEALLSEQLDHAREVWGDAVGPRYRGLLMAAWESVDVGESADRFFRVMQQLLQSADYHINAEALAQRVLALLQAMAKEPALRQLLLDIANDEWGCQDGATWCLSNLELNVLVWQAQADVQGNTEQTLLTLGRRLWRLDEVDRLAVLDILERGGNPDESEVGLAYRLGLRDRLNLPIEVGEMSFRPLAGVTEAHLARAQALVLEAETQEEVARSLVDRTFWQAHLERIHPARFTQVDRPFQRQVESVLRDETLSDEARQEQSIAILGAQRAARRGLMLDMTLAALEAGPPDAGIDV